MTPYHAIPLAVALYVYIGALIAHRVCLAMWRAYAKAARPDVTRRAVERACANRAALIIAIWPLWLVWFGARMALAALSESAERAARKDQP
jgi:hypothetical protein